MLADRGYYPSEESIHVFLNMTKPKIKVFFATGRKLNIELMKSFVANLQQEHIKHAIIVHDHVITSSTKKLLDHLWDIHVELFQMDELQFNITHHELYARHELLGPEDARQLKNIMKQLPIILKSDPVVRYFDYRKSDLLRIHRKDGSLCYRIVH